MRTSLARFAAVGSAVTAVDVGLFLAGWRGGRRSALRRVVAADVPALAAAGLVSWSLHRAITFRDDPYRRWLAEHEAFAATTVAAGAIDVAITGGLLALSGPTATTARAGLAAKLPAVAVAGTARWAMHRRMLFKIVKEGHVRRIDAPPPPGAVRLSVVIPAYDEADRIAATVATVRRALDGIEHELVVVDDGSADGTAARARAAGADQVVVQPRNRGKGAAVRAGVLAARGRTIAFTDADLAYAPEQIAGLLARTEAGWDVVVGSRRHDLTTTLVKARRLREIGGRVINFFTHAVVLGAYRDTQCGLKAFRADAARAIFERSRIDGFAFDIEVFVVAERNGLSIAEVPVQVVNSDRSTVKVVRDASRLVADLLRVRRWAREGRYQVDPVEGASNRSH